MQREENHRLENIVERECNTMTKCWELYRRLQEEKRKKKEEITSTDEEKQEVQKCWEETYGGNEESILEQRKMCCPIGLEEISQAMQSLGNRAGWSTK